MSRQAQGARSGSGAVAAVDLGATSGRVVLGRIGPDGIALDEVARFANDPVRLPDGLHWSVLELYRERVVAFDQVSPLGELNVRWAGADDEDVAADLAAIDEFEGAPGEQPAEEEGEGADEPAASA